MSLSIKKVEAVTLKGYPVEGNHNILMKCKTFLLAAENGYIVRSIKADLILGDELDIVYYYPCDKGGYALFGMNDKDIVCCALVFDTEDKKFYVVETTNTNPWL